MIDKQQAYNQQLSDFLKEYKNRFTIINNSGMPGKLGYSTKLNRVENCSMNIYLTDQFPLSAPLVYIVPRIDIGFYLDEMGRVRDSYLQYWNINSTLTNCVKSLLLRLESQPQLENKGFNKQSTFDYSQNQPQVQMNQGQSQGLSQVQGSWNNNNEPKVNLNTQNLYNDTSIYSINNVNNQKKSNESQILQNDLSNKSIEELIYIYMNQDEYVYEFMKQYKENLNTLKDEVNKLYDQCLMKKKIYDNESFVINEKIEEFNKYKNELTEVYYDKIRLDNSFTIDSLLEKVNTHLSQVNLEKQKVISDFVNKKISFGEFEVGFKGPSLKYHELCITKDKLYQIKNKEAD